MKKFYIIVIVILLVLFIANSLAYVFVPDYVEKEINDSKKELKDKLSNAIADNHFFVVDSDTRFVPQKVFNSAKYRTYVLNWDSCHWRFFTSVLKYDTLFNYVIVPKKIVLPISVPDDVAEERLQVINQLEYDGYVKSNNVSDIWYWDFCDSINKYESKYFEIFKDTTYCQTTIYYYAINKQLTVSLAYNDLKHSYKELGEAYHDSICAKEIFVIKRKTNCSSKALIQKFRNKIIISQVLETILLALIVIIVFLIVRKRKRRRIQRDYDSINNEARNLFEKEYENRYSYSKKSTYISQEIKDAARRLAKECFSNFESWKYKEFVIEHKDEIVEFLQKDALYVKVHELKNAYSFGFNEYAKRFGLYSDLSQWQEASLHKILTDESLNVIKETDNRLKIENEYKTQITNN